MRAMFADMWGGVSLRTRITGVTAVVLSIALIVLGIGVRGLLGGYLTTNLDMQLQTVLNNVSPNTVSDDETARATPFAFAHFEQNGQLIRANPTWSQVRPEFSRVRAAQVGSPRPYVTTVSNAGDANSTRLAVRQLPDGTVVALGQSMATINELLDRLTSLLYLFGLGVILGGTVLTRFLLISTLAPLRQVEYTAAAIAEGDFEQRLGQTRPNTEVGRLNRSLNRMLNRITDALTDRANTISQMRRFIGDASHELRTPLVSVRGYAELYRMGALTSPVDVAHAMDRIEREAIRLGTLVEDLLTLARLDEGKVKDPQPVELLPLAYDAVMDAKAQAPGRTIRVLDHDILPHPGPAPTEQEQDAYSTGNLLTGQLRLLRRRRDQQPTPTPAPQQFAESDATRPTILADENRVRQLLTNLVGNAIRYTPADTPIEIAVYSPAGSGHTIIDVIDHGEGVPREAREQIFERFWRADASRTRDTGGTGLGLSIVSAILTAYRGTINILDTPGGGAIFRVTFPSWDENS